MLLWSEMCWCCVCPPPIRKVSLSEKKKYKVLLRQTIFLACWYVVKTLCPVIDVYVIISLGIYCSVKSFWKPPRCWRWGAHANFCYDTKILYRGRSAREVQGTDLLFVNCYFKLFFLLNLPGGLNAWNFNAFSSTVN